MAKKVFTDESFETLISEIKSFVSGAVSGKANSNHNHIYYGVCSTAAGTAAKTVTVDGFSLVTGAMVIVKFTNANSVASPTLNVNSTGAKPICRYGTTAASTGTTTSGWRAGAVQFFVYDGTSWIRDFWENSTYSNASLGQGYGTCATAEATVAKVVTLSSYALTTGGIVAVKFTYAVPASATMNINSKGAKAIYYRGAAITAGVIKAGDIGVFIYDGSQYHLLTVDRDVDTTYSAAGSSLGLVKTGGDVTISSGVITVNDDSHNHVIANVDGLQTALDGKVSSTVEYYGDINNLVTSGFYRVGTNANLPPDCQYGQIIVSRGSDTVTQLAFSYHNGRVFTRSCNINNDVPDWGTWIEFYTTENPPITGGGGDVSGSFDLSYDSANESLSLVGAATWNFLTEKTGTTGTITLPTAFSELHILIGISNYMYTFNILKEYLTSAEMTFRNGYALSTTVYGDVYISVTKTSITAWTVRKENVVQTATVKVYYR